MKKKGRNKETEKTLTEKRKPVLPMEKPHAFLIVLHKPFSAEINKNSIGNSYHISRKFSMSNR
jgi:hypothetical protein